MCKEHRIFDDLTLCKTSLKLIEELLPNLYNKDETIKEMVGKEMKTRQKRGWFNAMGSIFKTVFGILDQNDAETYNSAINNITTNENHLLSLFKQQIHVVQSTITNFNSTITNMQRNKDIFNENFAKIKNLTQLINENYFNLELKQTVEEHLSLLTLLISELEREYSGLIDAILLAKNNQLHPMLMSPRKLIGELLKTTSHLPPGTSYPLPVEYRSAYRFLDIINIQYFSTENRIVFIISVPLISQTNFLLYNLIALPILSPNNHYVFILPNFDYLAVSENRNVYTILKNTDTCISISEFDLICDLREPIFSVKAQTICEIEILLTNPKQIPIACDTRLMNTQLEIWHKLKRTNTWIFVLSKPTDVTLNCEHPEVKNLLLSHTGIISIGSDCKIYTSVTTISAESEKLLENTFKAAAIPKFPLEENCCLNKIKNKSIKIEFIPGQAINLDKESLKVSSHKLENLEILADKITNDHSNFSDHIINNNYFVFFFCSVLKIFLIYCLYKLYKYCIKRNVTEENSTCCTKITNCLTFNVTKTRRPANLIVEFSPDESSDTTEDIPLRRSARIAKLKDPIDL